VSDFGGSSAAAEEPTPPEQGDLIEVIPLPFTPSTGLTMELVSKIIADAASLRNDEHLKDLAEKESLLIDQALRLSELEEQLKTESSAAAVTSKAAFESVVPQPYSPLEEELHGVFVIAKGFKLHIDIPGIKNEIDSNEAIAEFLSPVAPIPANAKHNGPPSLT